MGPNNAFRTNFVEAKNSGYSVRFFEGLDGSSAVRISGDYKTPNPIEQFLNWFDGSVSDIDISAKGKIGNGVHGASVAFTGSPGKVVNAFEGKLDLSEGAVKLGDVSVAFSYNMIGAEATFDIYADGDESFLNNLDFQEVFAGVQSIVGTHAEVLGIGLGAVDTTKAGFIVREDGIYIVGSLQGELGLLIYGDASLTGYYEKKVHSFNPECFLSGTPVLLWPAGLPLHFDSGDVSATVSDAGVCASLDANRDVSGATSSFDEALVVSRSISKPIESVEAGEALVAFRTADDEDQSGADIRIFPYFAVEDFK